MKFRVGYASKKAEITNEAGKWLDPYDWRHYATLTFRKNVDPDIAKSLFNEFVDEHGIEIYFMAVEWHRSRDCVHIHAILGEANTELLWQHGISKVVTYNKRLPARFYVAKFVANPYVDWDFRLPERREM